MTGPRFLPVIVKRVAAAENHYRKGSKQRLADCSLVCRPQANMFGYDFLTNTYK